MKGFIFTLLCTFFASLAPAQSSTLSVGSTVQAVAIGDVVLTREMHRVFWQELRMGEPMSDSAIRDKLFGALELNLAFQQSVFASAEESLRAGRVVRTPELELADSSFLGRAQAFLPAARDATAYRQSVRELERRFATMREDESLLLEAAARKSQFSLHSGFAGVADAQTLEKGKANLQATRRRLNQLLSPVWQELQQ
jgi:hypothetical protein